MKRILSACLLGLGVLLNGSEKAHFIQEVGKEYSNVPELEAIVYDPDFEKARQYALKESVEKPTFESCVSDVDRAVSERLCAMTPRAIFYLGTGDRSSVFLSNFCYQEIMPQWSRRPVSLRNFDDLLSVVDHELVHVNHHYHGIKVDGISIKNNNFFYYSLGTINNVEEFWANRTEVENSMSGKRKLSEDYLVTLLHGFAVNRQELERIYDTGGSQDRELVEKVMKKTPVHLINFVATQLDRLEPKYRRY